MRKILSRLVLIVGFLGCIGIAGGTLATAAGASGHTLTVASTQMLPNEGTTYPPGEWGG